MKEHFALLFQYEKWATGRVLATMKQLPVQDEKCLEWMGHILAGQFVWHARITNTNIKYELWGKRTIQECEKMLGEATKMWTELFSTLNDAGIEKIIHYKTFKGEPFENSLKD